MVRGARKTQVRCEQHEFSLKPRGDYMVHPQHLSASFCSDNAEKGAKRTGRASGSACLNCPTFNQDGNHATPAFVLVSEKVLVDARRHTTRNAATR